MMVFVSGRKMLCQILSSVSHELCGRVDVRHLPL